ncbi:MAG: hypothetical protein IPM32_08755 [Ignavibacteriae bacterium]|nr:hypothetical protein [Ignavibacteriota bacterium]
MQGIQVNRDILFIGSDFLEPRIIAEKRKLKMFFPQFEFYGIDKKITSVRGLLTTNLNNSYNVRISVTDSYPYEIPIIELIDFEIDEECPHKYYAGNLCIMRPDHWSSVYSLAYVVARTAVWLNKYDIWRRNGKEEWPGKDSHKHIEDIAVR